MKLLAIILICAVLFLSAGNSERPVKMIRVPAITAKDSIDYTGQVLPVLQKSCSPCHFPGGKMYEKMPFDKLTTIINHQEGILRRTKNKPEMEPVRKFIQQIDAIN